MTVTARPHGSRPYFTSGQTLAFSRLRVAKTARRREKATTNGATASTRTGQRAYSATLSAAGGEDTRSRESGLPSGVAYKGHPQKRGRFFSSAAARLLPLIRRGNGLSYLSATEASEQGTGGIGTGGRGALALPWLLKRKRYCNHSTHTYRCIRRGQKLDFKNFLLISFTPVNENGPGRKTAKK